MVRLNRAGGGGNSKERKSKIEEKNQRLNEQRQRRRRKRQRPKPRRVMRKLRMIRTRFTQVEGLMFQLHKFFHFVWSGSSMYWLSKKQPRRDYPDNQNNVSQIPIMSRLK